MIKILYVGNYLKSQRNNISSIHVLGDLLSSEGYEMTFTSAQTSKILRLIEMVSDVVKQKDQIDIVIIDTYSTLNFYFALIISQLCRYLKIPYLTNLNGGNMPHRLKNNPYLSSLIFRNSYYNVAPSEYLIKAFKDYGYGRLLYIPNTLKIDHYPFQTRLFDAPRLLWVRSFSKIYNPRMAIEVLKILRETFPTSTLTMVGPDSDGSLKDVKESAKQKNVKVNFTGKLSKQEWTELSKNHNIFINTTNFDNTPVSVIEAMALGLPIVSTDVGGMPHLIDQEIHGLLVPPNNPQAMADAIVRIFKNQELRNFVISNARSRAEQFDWEEVKVKWKVILGERLEIRD
ncbi:Glycosyltransferase involved in cell wall bisynthesis [Flavobacteriaceae bacterium MAR_2010_188]|nr:Glycosyltransferase involved in cell wall bisynthesis [Flavobacteriaceae bacterium MAR_2010_188]